MGGRRAPSPQNNRESCFLLPGQGTTTNGEYLLPFKTGAFLAGAPVQPVILCYGKVGTQKRALRYHPRLGQCAARARLEPEAEVFKNAAGVHPVSN